MLQARDIAWANIDHMICWNVFYSDESGGSIILDLERQRGDGEEEQNEESKKVDDDEDRSNPQYIPKRGIFYEHDDRTADDP